MRSKRKVVCPYCEIDAELTSSAKLYGGKYYGMIWLCGQCKASVGVHKNTTEPLGTLANRKLKDLRRKAHLVFDPLWKTKADREKISKTKAREAGYRWLSEQLGITLKKCHIGEMREKDCLRVISLCQQYKQNKSA